MSKTFRPYEPDQDFLMLASMRDWLPSDHLAHFISDVVDHLDVSAIMERSADEERGYPPYHPCMMVNSTPLCLLHRCGFVTEDREASL